MTFRPTSVSTLTAYLGGAARLCHNATAYASLIFTVLLAVFLMSQRHKVLRTVIILNAVYMVNVFVRLKRSSVSLLPDGSVFKDVALICARIVGTVQQDVASIIDPPSLPFRAVFSSWLVRVSGESWFWIPSKPPLVPIGVFTNVGFPSASALARTARDFFWRGAIAGRLRLSAMAGYVFRFSVFMFGRRDYPASTTTSTVFHSDQVSANIATCLV